MLQIKELNIVTVNPIKKNIMDKIVTLYADGNMYDFAKHVRMSNGSSETFDFKGYEVKLIRDFPDYDNDAEIFTKLQSNKHFAKLMFYIPKKLIVTEKVEGVYLEYYKRHNKENIKAHPSCFDEIKEAYAFAQEQGISLNGVGPHRIIINREGHPVIVDVCNSQYIQPNDKVNFDFVLRSYNDYLN